MRNLLLAFLLVFSVVIYGQDGDKKEGKGLKFKSVRPKAKKIDSILSSSKNYKIITYFRDTTYVDTTLSISKYYKHNAFRKDMFEYMPMNNEGMPIVNLGYNFRDRGIFAEMGGSVNKPYMIEAESVNYYYLPSPMTEFLYKNGINEGQILNSLFSANITKDINMYVSYNALKSLGEYQNESTKMGAFVIGGAYSSKNKKYFAIGHYSNENIDKQENAGMLNNEQFTSGDAQFKNRGGIDVNFNDADFSWQRKRYFFSHQYNFLREGNKINSKILLKHTFKYETSWNKFLEKKSSKYFGDSYVPENVSAGVDFKTMLNKFGAELVLPYLGRTYVYGKAYSYKYLYKSVFYDANGNRYPSNLKGNEYGLGLEWATKYKGFWIDAKGEQMLVGNLLGTNIEGKLGYDINEESKIWAGVKLNSSMPSLNKILYFSDYKNYNWYNNFDKENTQVIYADAETKWGSGSVDLVNMNNYTYFFLDWNKNFSVNQEGGNIQYLKIKANKDVKFWKFGLDNTLMYQKVIQDKEIFNVPEFVTRNSLYFSTDLFDKAMFLQTGISMKYFTKYYSSIYNPLLNEMVSQDSVRTANYPYFDLFLNAKVQTMRIFISLENANSGFIGGYNYFVGPNEPYRDRVFRFGIVWNFFS